MNCWRKIRRYTQSHHWLWFLFSLTALILIYAVWQHSYTWYFQDETDHLVPAWMMLRDHGKLYHDLSTNHQPIAIIYSLIIMRLVKFRTLWQLIPQIRLTMLGFSLVVGFIATWRFRWKGFFAWLNLAFLSYYFFGFHVLGEVFAAYAILILTLYWLVAKKINNLDAFIFAFFSFLAGFSLLPTIVYLAIINGLFLRKLNKQQRLILLTTLALLIITMFAFIPPLDWFRETIVNNWLYWLPFNQSLGFVKQFSMLIYPFSSLVQASSWSRINLFYFVSLLICFLPFLTLKSFKSRPLATFVISLFLIGLLNNRVSQADTLFYQGFHLLPYLAAFIVLTSKQFFLVKNKLVLQRLKYLLFALGLIFISHWIFTPVQRLQQYDEKYSPYQNIANILLQLSQPGDRFLSGPDGAGYINLAAHLPIAGRQLFHLDWSWRSPLLRRQFVRLMTTHPPEFLLFYNDNGQYARFLQPILTQKYQALYDQKHHPVFLYILRRKWDKLNQQQQLVVTQRYQLTPKSLPPHGQ